MPDKIAHYTIVSQLGRGGMGVVYKAHEESLNRYVAIKVLGEHLAEDQSFLTRFIREAQAAAGLSHPNIVQIFYIGEDSGKHYFVMEYVSGKSLHSMIKEEGRIDNPRAAQLILQAANGLAAAHDEGIIHRDIKPANLMLDPRGTLKIADFGLALPVESQTRLTATGMLMGTPGYLAPEQCRNEQVDLRTDIYALGVTYYELLTGSQPFKADSPLALLKQILDEDPPDIKSLNPSVDNETRRILEKMIEKDRDLRYQDCHELAQDLEEYIHSKGLRSATQGLATTVVPPTMPGGKADPALNAHADRTRIPDAPTQVTPASGSSDPTAVTPAPGSSAAPTAVTPAAGTSEAPTVVTPAGGISEAPTIQTPAPGTPPPPPAAAAPRVPTPPAPAASPQGAVGSSKPKSSSKGLFIAVILAFLLVGGAGASFVAWKVYKGESFFGNEGSAVAALDEGADKSDSGDALKTSAATMPDSGVGSDDAGAGAGNLPEDGMTPANEGTTPIATDQGTKTAAKRQTESSTPSEAKSQQAGAAKSSKSTTPPPPPPLSGAMLAVSGDPNLVPYVTDIMMTELSSSGINAEDASALPGWDDLMRQDPQTGYLVDQVKKAGFATLVLVRVDPAGERQLKYMGRYDTAYSARVTIQRYDIATGRPVGQRASTAVEYTQLNAEREAEKKVGPLAREFTAGF